MSDHNRSGKTGSFGEPEQIAVERGLAEFRSGRPVILKTAGETVIALPIDGISDERLEAFLRLCAPARPHIIITKQRARALGLETEGAIGLARRERDTAHDIISLAADADVDRKLDVIPAGPAAGAAIELAKLAHKLPALLVANRKGGALGETPLIELSADAVAKFAQATVDSLAIVAKANVPLEGGLQAQFVIFRDAVGGSSVAVIVGTPDISRPVPVRLHSACLTGDVFGSRRCDCGDQLRLSLRRLEEEGGGIVLYLEQEGRGLGLANKMRTYQLQDAGLDTLDANTTLGFDDDERDYGIAARMLQMLGCTRVALLTNNPAKLDGLAEAGIEISGRIPLHGPINADNRRYLTAKATRAGHKLDHLLTALAESEAVGEGTP